MTLVSKLLLDLIAIPSVSNLSNQKMIDYACSRLAPEYWDVQTHSYVDATGVTKTNLTAITKNADGGPAELSFVCHTDTVPFETSWSEAVHPALRDGRIYGRGSCDVKGFMACVFAALEEIDLARLHEPLGLMFTADEEVGCVGAKKLAKQRALFTRYMIIGEPTGLQPIRAGKGYGLATITVQGREAHSAFPSAGRSAIVDAARLIPRLELVAAELERFKRSEFDPPFTTLNVGLITGGTAKNIVPGECRLVVEWRPVLDENPERVPDLIREQIQELSRSFPGFVADLKIERIDPPFAPSKTQRLSDALGTVFAREAGTIAFGSEAAHLSSLAEEVVVFGPGDMTVAHKTGEYVPVAELERCVQGLAEIIRQEVVSA